MGWTSSVSGWFSKIFVDSKTAKKDRESNELTAAQDRKINEYIEKLNREYEVKTTLRNKFEELYRTFNKHLDSGSDLLEMKISLSTKEMLSSLDFIDDMELLINLYFPLLKEPFKRYIDIHTGFLVDITQKLDSFHKGKIDLEIDPDVCTIGQFINLINENMITVKGNAVKEFRECLVEVSGEYTFVNIERS